MVLHTTPQLIHKFSSLSIISRFLFSSFNCWSTKHLFNSMMLITWCYSCLLIGQVGLHVAEDAVEEVVDSQHGHASILSASLIKETVSGHAI